MPLANAPLANMPLANMPLARFLSSACLIAILSATGLTTSTASDGDPLAVRRWPDGSVSIESHWGLELRVSPDESVANRAATENPNRHRVSFVPSIDHALARQPNQNAATWKPVAGQTTDNNTIRVRSIINDDKRSGALMVRVDGVTIVLLSPSLGEIAKVHKQMPPDYSAAHPDWDGAEEARQMKRVSEFTRRFAYLLHDAKLQAKAPGSRWTLVGLLRQMERHYDEHTANTIKKFELPDWPGAVKSLDATLLRFQR